MPFTIRYLCNAPDARTAMAIALAVQSDPRVIGCTIDGVDEAPSPWRPIQSAPKNGSTFIGFDANIGLVHSSSWHPERKCWVDFETNDAPLTHWMPLPPL